MTDNDLMPQLKRGDVVLFAWSGRPPDPTYREFAHLAGAVQALGHRKPTHTWFHVGVMADSENVIEFGQEGLPDWKPLRKHRLDRAGRQPITVLQAADSNDAETLAAAMEGHLAEKTPYNIAALLAFAFATQRRVFGKTSDVHKDLGIITNGALSIAKNQAGGSCVSLIVDALELTVEEPLGNALNPTPTIDRVQAAVASITDILRMEESLALRVVGGQLGSQLAGDTSTLYQAEAIASAYYSDGALSGEEQGVIGPMVDATVAYVDLLRKAVGTFFPGATHVDLRKEANNEPYDIRNVPSLLVSPAMLYDALIARGFTKV